MASDNETGGGKPGSARPLGRQVTDAKATGAGEVELASQPARTPTEDALRRALSAVDAAMTDDAASRVDETVPPADVAPANHHDTAAASGDAGHTAQAIAAAAVAAPTLAPNPTPAPPATPSPSQGLAPSAARANTGDEPHAPTGDDVSMSAAKTQIVRGPRRPTRTDFHQEPVVGWLVVIGGPGLGAFRPLFTGNNTIGRSPNQRVPVDFGDDAISAEEQAYIRYDAADREFLFVPNLSKTNVVSVNDAKPTTALKLAPMDVITMGQTQLVFVPFCGEEFDWSELADL